jgi:predicted Zn-dependent peptidase
VSGRLQTIDGHYYQQYAARIAAVRREDVVRVARQYVDVITSSS